jgi:Tfp pilus assembly protein PilV
VNKTNGQWGFTVVEALLIVLVLSVISFGGYFVWHTQNIASKDTTSDQPLATKSSTNTKANTADTNAGYFVIKEWGVRAKYNGSLHLTYKLNVSATPQNVGFSSTELDASGALCKQDGSYGGRVERYKSTDHYLIGDFGNDSGKTAEQYAATLKQGEYGHAGDYYFFHIPPQAACGDTAKSDEVQSRTLDAVTSLVENIEPIPAQ